MDRNCLACGKNLSEIMTVENASFNNGTVRFPTEYWHTENGKITGIYCDAYCSLLDYERRQRIAGGR